MNAGGAERNGNHNVDIPSDPDARDEGAAAPLEMKMNKLVLVEVTYAGFARTIGSFGLVLATVLVLGGFKWNLSQIDFWFVACLSILQPYRIFADRWWLELEILFPMPLAKPTNPILSDIQDGLKKFYSIIQDGIRSSVASLLPTEHVVTVYSLAENLFFFEHLAKKLLSLLNSLLVPLCVHVYTPQLFAWACIILSTFRLVVQNFGDTNQSLQNTTLNPVLNLFYGLVFAQGLLSYFVGLQSAYCSKELSIIREKYNLDLGGRPLLQLYYLHVRKMGRDGDFPRAMRMTLASFALDTLSSGEPETRLDGVQVLRSLIRAEPCKVAATSKALNCPDAIESLFRMIALTGQDATSRATRKEASIVVTELAASLRVSGFPRSVHAICSLLQAGGDDELIVEGLKILIGLSNNTDNLVQLSSSVELMCMITDIARQWESTEKAKSSLAVVGRFAGAAGRQGNTLRRTIWEDEPLMATVREILQNPDAHGELWEVAIDVVAGFALDVDARNCGATRKVLGTLLSIFSDPPREAMPNAQMEMEEDEQERQARLAEQVRLAAGNALVGLTTESEDNCAAILLRGDLQSLRQIYNEQQAARRAAAANILRNMCAYLEREGPDGHGIMDFNGGSISSVLTTIYETDNLVGEVMEAFLGVAVQLCEVFNPQAEFEVALTTIGSENFARKLKSVLDEANGPQRAADWRPGIRRSAIELVIWIMRSEDQLHCTRHFVGCEMRRALMLVRTDKAENYKLMSAAGVPVLEHEESLAALVKAALRLIPEAPNGQ